MSLISEILSGAGSAYITQEGIDKARELPGQLATTAQDIAGRVGEAAEFRPYTVTTGAGSAQFDPTGMTQQLNAQDQSTVNALRQQASQQAGMLGNVTPEQLMSQMQALRAPEQERAQLGLENRLAAQGRLGLQTAAYGGSPEQLAMQKAIQEQQSADAFGAITQARQLQGMDIANLTSMLGAAGIPQQQLTAAMQPSLTGMSMAQQPAQLQAQAIANLGQQQLVGIPSAMNAEALLRQAQLESMTNLLMPQMNKDGNLVSTSTSNALGGLGDTIGDFLGDAGGSVLDWIGGLFSGGNVDWAVDPQSAVQDITGADIARLTGGATGAQTTNYNTPTGISVTGTAGRTGGANLPPTGP